MNGRMVKGYALAAVAAATYGMNPLFTLPLYDVGMTADSVLFFRYLLAIPIVALMIRLRGRSFKVDRRAVTPLVLLGLLMAFSSLGLFLSYGYMDAGIASSLLFVYPIMVAVIMTLFYKEKLSAITVCCTALALTGIAMLYNGAPGATLSLIGTIWVMLSALAYAIYIVGVNRPRLNKIPTLTVTFYVLLFGLSLFVVRLLIVGEVTVPPVESWYMWGCVLCLAVFPTVISFLCTTRAIQLIGSTPTAILGALEPVTAVFFGVLVFDERLSFKDIVGLTLIITAVSCVVAAPELSKRITAVRRMFPRIRRR